MGDTTPVAIVDDAMLLEEDEPFDPSDAEAGGWAFVEIMGHRSHYGYAREVKIFGAPMCEVLVPFADRPGIQSRHAYGGGAIFSITPCSRERCKKAAEPSYRAMLGAVAFAEVKINISDELGDPEETGDCDEDDDELDDRAPDDVADGFHCAACGHEHRGTRFDRLAPMRCVDCACPLTAPPPPPPAPTKEEQP